MNITHQEFSECFTFLDNLRQSGVANMFGARSYIEEAFKYDSKKAGEISTKWMETFDDEIPIEERVKAAMGSDFFLDVEGYAVPTDPISFKE